jgi:hypothetical protein
MDYFTLLFIEERVIRENINILSTFIVYIIIVFRAFRLSHTT